MKRISALVLSAAFFSTIFAGASQPSPNPHSEMKKQDFFAGTWRLEGTTRASPFGPGGQKFNSTEQLEWMPGGLVLVAHSYADGKLVEVTIIGYDPKEKVFTHRTFKSTGEREIWKGTAEHGSWTWTRDETVKGKRIKDRLTIKKTAADSYSFIDEMQPEGGKWSTVAEGTGIKTKG